MFTSIILSIFLLPTSTGIDNIQKYSDLDQNARTEFDGAMNNFQANLDVNGAPMQFEIVPVKLGGKGRQTIEDFTIGWNGYVVSFDNFFKKQLQGERVEDACTSCCFT